MNILIYFAHKSVNLCYQWSTKLKSMFKKVARKEKVLAGDLQLYIAKVLSMPSSFMLCGE